LKEKIIKLKYLLRWLKKEKFNFRIEKNLNYYNKENNNNMLLDEDSGSIVFDDFVLENKKVPDEIYKKNSTFSSEKNRMNRIKKNNSFNKSRAKLQYNRKTRDL
jgi:hypothetical protein